MPDARIRELERAALAGDPSATRRFCREQTRRGEFHPPAICWGRPPDWEDIRTESPIWEWMRRAFAMPLPSSEDAVTIADPPGGELEGWTVSGPTSVNLASPDSHAWPSLEDLDDDIEISVSTTRGRAVLDGPFVPAYPLVIVDPYQWDPARGAMTAIAYRVPMFVQMNVQRRAGAEGTITLRLGAEEVDQVDLADVPNGEWHALSGQVGGPV